MFQSSPAPKDGRYTTRFPRWTACRCFNPRPPRRTGATGHVWAVAHGFGVSILARPEGRALQPRFDLLRQPFPVSILARPEGRALPELSFDIFPSRSFNPRPPRRTGATRNNTVTNHHYTEFQSSPAPKDGRYPSLFGQHGGPMVSILARPEGRALRIKSMASCAETLSFNPRPPRRTGATFREIIRAGAFKKFQSSPAPKDGRYRTTSPRPEITYFSHGFRERIKLSLRCTNFTIARFIQVIEK